MHFFFIKSLLFLFSLEILVQFSSLSIPKQNWDSIFNSLNNYPENERIKILNNYAEENLKDNSQLSINLAEEALQFAIKLGDISGKYDAYTNIGVGYMNFGLFNKAVDNFEQAYEIARLLGNQKKLTSALLNTGNAYKSLGKNDKALRNFIQAENIAGKLADTNLLVNSYINLGKIYQSLSNFDRALDFFYQSLNLEKEIKDDAGIAKACLNIGNVYSDLGNFELSFSFHFDALKKFEELQDQNGIASTNLNLALLYKKWGRYNEALKYLEKTKSIADNLGNVDILSKTYYYLGDIYLSQGKVSKGEEYLKTSLNLAASGDNRPMLRTIYFALANLMAEKGEYKQAFLFYQHYMNIYDSLSNEEVNNKITQLQLDEKDNENKILRKDNEIKRLQIEKQRSLRFIYIIILVFILTISIVLYILFNIRKKHALNLEELNNNLEVLVKNRTYELEMEVAERRKSEEALKISEQKYRDIIEHLPISYSELDKNMKFMFVNKSGIELTGYSQDEFKNGLSIMDMVPEKEKLKDNIENALNGTKNDLEQYSLIRKNGAKIDVLIKFTPILSNYKKEGVRSTIIDITDHNAMHKALRESEEKFR